MAVQWPARSGSVANSVRLAAAAPSRRAARHGHLDDVAPPRRTACVARLLGATGRRLRRMCRVLAYLGEPVLLDDFLYKPDNSLVKQTYAPAMLHMLNLAGMGLLAWDRESHDPGRPFAYHSTALPVFDPNLESLAQKVKAGALLAHVRGVPYSTGAVVGPQNLHPFRYEGCPLAMAHNGDLARFAEMRFDLLHHIRPAIASRIRGTTDSPRRRAGRVARRARWPGAGCRRAAPPRASAAPRRRAPARPLALTSTAPRSTRKKAPAAEPSTKRASPRER